MSQCFTLGLNVYVKEVGQVSSKTGLAVLVLAVVAAVVATIVIKHEHSSTKQLTVNVPKSPVPIGASRYVMVMGSASRDYKKRVIILLYAPGVSGFYHFEQFTSDGGNWSANVGPIGAAGDPAGSWYKIEVFSGTNECGDAIWALKPDSSGSVHLTPLPKACAQDDWSHRTIIKVHKAAV